jgi:hypothetical protein
LLRTVIIAETLELSIAHDFGTVASYDGQISRGKHSLARSLDKAALVLTVVLSPMGSKGCGEWCVTIGFCSDAADIVSVEEAPRAELDDHLFFRLGN